MHLCMQVRRADLALIHGCYDIHVNSGRAMDIFLQMNPRKMELEGISWCSLGSPNYGYDGTISSKNVIFSDVSVVWLSSIGYPELSQLHLHINFALILVFR